jgi:arginyl-tRNA synthetase
MFIEELNHVAHSIEQILSRLDLPQPDSINWSPTPFEGEWGFGTSICFRVAAEEARRKTGVNVPARAQEIAQTLAEEANFAGFARAEAVRGYLNVYIEPSDYARRVVGTILQQGADFGRGEAKRERVMVEYAQPNTHHSFHIGHARNTVLGEALARLVEFAGFDTIRASYPGDMGLGVMTCVWAYHKFYAGQEPDGVHERGQWLAKIYTEATAMLTPRENETPEEREQRERYDAERREMYRKWDAGDPEVRELWHRTRQWSLDELDEILDMLDVDIDVFFFESEMAEPAKEIAEELVERGIAEDERPEGPVIVKIDEKLGLEEEEKYRTAVILRSDGTTLYLTNDLALAKRKFEQYHVDRSIYVVDTRQSLHFQQAFKILELMGFPQASKCYHLAYGFVTLPEGAMSARLGNVVLFKAVADEAQRRVLEIIAEKNPSMPEDVRELVSQQIGLGALKYHLLSVDNNKDTVFDWDVALSFDGQSAPYIQNARVRANSILKKAEGLPDQVQYNYDLETQEVKLIELLARFPETVQQAALGYKPLHMANYVYELARTFHTFYHAVPVLQAETEDIRAARLHLTAATRTTLTNALRLLSIEAPDVM